MDKKRKLEDEIILPKIPLDKNGNPKDPLDDVKYPKRDIPNPYNDPLDDVK